MKKIIAISLLTFCLFGTSCQIKSTANKTESTTNIAESNINITENNINITKENIKDYLGFEVTYSDFNITENSESSSSESYKYYISCCMHIKTFSLYENLSFKDAEITYSKSFTTVSPWDYFNSFKISIRPDGTSEATIYLYTGVTFSNKLIASKVFPNSSNKLENFSILEAEGTVVITTQNKAG